MTKNTLASILDPKIDIVFQALFGDPRMKSSLISLLSAIIKPEIPIEDVEFLNPKIPKDYVEQRGSVLDVLVELDDGSKIDIEMQMRRSASLRSRSLYYWGKVFTSGLSVGDDYKKISPAVVIIFLNDIEFTEEKSRFHHVFFAAHEQNPQIRLKGFRIDFIELPKTALLPEARIADKELSEWSLFLLDPTVEDLNEVYMKRKDIKKALNRLQELSQDPEIREAARQREMAGVLLKISLEESREEGIAIGLERGEAIGLKKGREQTLRSLYQLGVLTSVPLGEVAQTTGIPEDEIKVFLSLEKKKQRNSDT